MAGPRGHVGCEDGTVRSWLLLDPATPGDPGRKLDPFHRRIGVHVVPSGPDGGRIAPGVPPS